jgi:hypothetical protein
MRNTFPRSALAVLALLVMLVQGTWVLAGTTGGLSGTVTDVTNGKALAGVKVTVTSPSQNVTATTDQAGKYSFVSLAPDTYTLIVSAPGYQPVSVGGITVQADQTLTYSVTASKSITEIGRTRSRSATDLVKPGQTADVYSINSALTANAQGLGGGSGLFQTYAALASVPGVYMPQGSTFGQNTSGPYIRGGNYDQVGYEYDGIPVNRAFDNYVSNTQGITGQQELQVYTGGVSASSAGQGLSGYINQTIKTGTFPATANAEGVLGAPIFYHYLRGEYGGASPNRNFSYYVGSTGWSQSYRSANQFDGGLMGPNDLTLVGFTNGNNDPATGTFNTKGGITLAPYHSGAVPNLSTRETVGNIHFGIPHRNGDGKDDIQLLGSVGRQFFSTYDSLNDYGGAGSDVNTNYAGGGPYPYPSAIVYNGPIFSGFNAANLSRYYYPGMPKGCTPVNAAGACNIDPNLRGTEDNNNGILKFQYQKNIGSSAYVRLYGYTNYSVWNIYDPPYLAANLEPFSVVGSREYQLSTHTRGVSLDFADQINSKNLITGSASYTTATVTRANNRSMQPQAFAAFRVQLRDANGSCYSPTTGALTNCYTSATSLGGGFTAATLPSTLPAIGGAAATNGAQYQVVTSGYQVTLNQVVPKFGNVSLSDQWQPSDRLKLDFGFRYNSYVYGLFDTSSQAVVGGTNALIFQNYNQEHCYNLSSRVITRATAPSFACPAGTAHTDLSNSYPGNVAGSVFEPRFSGTYTIDPYNVVRFSAGKYSQPINSAYVQYNYAGDLAVYTANNFFAYGFNTPRHDARPQLSFNYDLSYETRLKNAPVSASITPFYRRTQDQQQQFYLDPVTNFVSGLNVGTLRAFGFEALARYGDFNRDGWSGQVSFAYTNSKIKYKNFSGTNLNIIDNINASLGAYNGLTQSGGGSPCYAGTTATGLVGGACPAGSLPNPYYASAQAPFLDRNGWYSGYTVTPAAALGLFAVGSGASYEVPYVTTAIVQYRKNGWRFVPTFQYDSGARYGNPFTWIGYDPSSGACPPTDTSQCVFNAATVFRPNPYTGRYDSLGEFKSPGQLTISMQMSKDLSKRVTATAILSNLYRHCFTRGYAWEQGGSQVCNYFTQAPLGVAAGGTYLGNSTTPAGAYRVQNDPFGYSPGNTGLPFNAFFSLQVKM